jgi:hypothetical protein
MIPTLIRFHLIDKILSPSPNSSFWNKYQDHISLSFENLIFIIKSDRNFVDLFTLILVKCEFANEVTSKSIFFDQTEIFFEKALNSPNQNKLLLMVVLAKIKIATNYEFQAWEILMIISLSHFLSQSDSILKYQVAFISFQVSNFIADHSHLLLF